MKSGKKAVRVVRKRLADGTIKEYRYRRAAPGLGYSDPQSLASLIRAYQRSPQWTALASRTVENYVRYLKPLSHIGHVKVVEIRRKHLMLIRNEIMASRGPGAADAFCRAASALFAWAVDYEWIENSPAVRLRKAIQLNELPTWTEEQVDIALAGLPEHYRRAVVLALHTGQRRGDLCALRWDAYRDGRLTIEQEKSRRRGKATVKVSIPIVAELGAELDRWKREARGLTILETSRGMPWIPGYLSRTLPLELRKLGLPKGLNIHGLRKLAATRLANAGCTAHEIASITGHRTLAMVELYTKAANQRILSDAAVLKLKRKPRSGNQVSD